MSRTPDRPSASELDFGSDSPSSSRSRGRRGRRRKSSPVMPAIVGGCLLAAAALVWFVFSREEEVAAAASLKVSPMTIPEGEAFRYRPTLEIDGLSRSDLSFAATNMPVGMMLDEATGDIEWTPTEEQGPGEFVIPLVIKNKTGQTLDEATLTLTVDEQVQPPTLTPFEPLSARVGDEVSVTLSAFDPDIPATPLAWTLDSSGAAATARIDPVSSTLFWTIDESVPVGTHDLTVTVAKSGHPNASASQVLSVLVTRPMSPIDTFVAKLNESGVRATRAGTRTLKPFSKPAEVVSVGGEDVFVLHYKDSGPLIAEIDKIDPEGKTLDGEEVTWTEPARFYSGANNLLAFYEGDNETVVASLSKQFGQPFATGTPMRTPTETGPAPPTEREETILALYDDKRLFRIDEYPTLRKLYAAEFAAAHANRMRSALGSDADAMLGWLAEHDDFREEFYLALDPEADDIGAAARVVNELRLSDPDRLAEYGNLAIALAVTWDQPRNVYDYGHHASRTSSQMPSNPADMLANWKYFLEAESVMQGRAQWLPWEFQVFLINHKTPQAERSWAVNNFLNGRSMIGRIYSKLPYDTVMLETESKTCRLGGKEYTLPNLLNFGGVCAMQADFAARTAKALGVPAEYVGGEGRFGSRHAWVMWVEVRNVTQKGIQFSLESHGRYRGDRYYVGTLKNSKTGRRMTDRELELYLHVVGSDPIARRFANLIVRSLPVVDTHRERSPDQKLKDLEGVLKLSPGNPPTWEQVAALASDPELERKHERKFVTILNQFFGTFGHFPDFTWTIFDRLIDFEDDDKQRIKLYERLTALYEGAGRPDLASDARLKLTELLLADERLKEASQGLGFTILRFADEGRFVIDLLDKLEEIAQTIPDSDQELATFYLNFLSKIPTKRGSTPSEYCIKMHERAITRLRAMNRPDLVSQVEARLAAVRAGQA